MLATLFVPLLGLGAVQATPPPAGSPAPPAPVAGLADVAFMAGHWLGGEEGDLSEEVWTEPAGDSMLGMWRYVSLGQARVFELLTLKAEPEGVVLRLRHFDPVLAAREERATPVALRLVAHAPGEATFEGPAVGGPGTVRLSYRREGPDALVSVLTKRDRPQEFRFRRAPGHR